MFDDTTKEPDDMFEATDKVAPQVTAPTDEPPPVQPDQALSGSAPILAASILGSPARGFPWRTVLLIVGILVVVGAAFFLSLRILGSRTPVTPEPPSATANREKSSEVVPVVEEVEEIPSVLVAPTPSTGDTDKDGLTDEEEADYGTSPRAADTDGDELFDLEEVRTWKTDPLNPDTDGDGYLDGKEVKAGYNPNGDGSLREAPTESS